MISGEHWGRFWWGTNRVGSYVVGGQGLLQEREESNPPDSRIKNREMGSVLLIGGRSARELSGSPSPGSQACLPV